LKFGRVDVGRHAACAVDHEDEVCVPGLLNHSLEVILARFKLDPWKNVNINLFFLCPFQICFVIYTVGIIFQDFLICFGLKGPNCISRGLTKWVDK
jgi:hypothetical protein